MAEHLTHNWEEKQFRALVEALDSQWSRHLLYQILANQEKEMASLENAQAALAQLQTDVTALINKPATGVPEADVQALADGMNALDATIPKA